MSDKVSQGGASDEERTRLVYALQERALKLDNPLDASLQILCGDLIQHAHLGRHALEQPPAGPARAPSRARQKMTDSHLSEIRLILQLAHDSTKSEESQ